MDILVRDCMRTDLITVDPRCTLPAAHLLLHLNAIRRLPVVTEDGRLVGIVTLGDIRAAGSGKAGRKHRRDRHRRRASMEVRDFMTPDLITVRPNATIQEAAQLLLDYKIGGLPVVENGTPVGIITESDIFRLVVASGALTHVRWDEAERWGLNVRQELHPG